MDDFDKYLQDRLKRDKKFAYVHNKLLNMGYAPKDFPSELIYKLGDEFEKQQKLIKNSPETINTSLVVIDELIQTLKDTPTSSFVEFEKENKQAKKVKDNVWEIDGKRLTTSNLLKFLNILPQTKKENKMFTGFKINENWDYGDKDRNYIDLYAWKDDTQDNIEFNEVTAALKEFLQSDFTDYESLINLELVPWEEKRGYFKIIPIFGEVDLVGYTIPAYEVLNKDVEKDYNLSEIEREDVQDAREKLINNIEEINRKLPELQSWGFKKYKTGEKFNTDLINEGWSYKDKHGLEVVDLEYYDLPYEAYYGPMDWETGVGKNYINTIIPSYVYTADKQDIEEFFANFLYEKDPEYTSIEDDEKAYEYISQNFDNLMDKYYDDVLEEFKENAIEDAYNKHSPEDFEYYPD